MPIKHANSIVAIVVAMLIGSAIAEDRHERHEHRFANDVDAFHSALAPLWHARAGRERSQKVCAQASKLESLAKEIHSADAKPLLASIASLRTQCRASPTEIDGVFSQVHEAFHRLAEPIGH
jgi:hypothetical protein